MTNPILKIITSSRVLCGFIATIAALFFGVTALTNLPQKFEWLGIVAGMKLLLLFIAIVFTALSYGAGMFVELRKPQFEYVQGPYNEALEKANLRGFEREIEEGAKELKKEAKEYFDVAERDFSAAL